MLLLILFSLMHFKYLISLLKLRDQQGDQGEVKGCGAGGLSRGVDARWMPFRGWRNDVESPKPPLESLVSHKSSLQCSQ